MPPSGRPARIESEPVVPRRGIAFIARVFPAVTGTSVVPETIGPPAKTERVPVADGLTTVTFAATEIAVEGMPQRPATGRISVWAFARQSGSSERSRRGTCRSM